MKPLSPAAVCGALLAVANRVLAGVAADDRHPWAAQAATADGYTASAVDDACPRCSIEWGTTWLYGDDVLGLNWWIHDTSYESDVVPCGLVWPTRIRRPGNGVWFVRVDRRYSHCLVCQQWRKHWFKSSARRYVARHTAMHEAEVSR